MLPDGDELASPLGELLPLGEALVLTEADAATVPLLHELSELDPVVDGVALSLRV